MRMVLLVLGSALVGLAACWPLIAGRGAPARQKVKTYLLSLLFAVTAVTGFWLADLLTGEEVIVAAVCVVGVQALVLGVRLEMWHFAALDDLHARRDEGRPAPGGKSFRYWELHFLWSPVHVLWYTRLTRREAPHPGGASDSQRVAEEGVRGGDADDVAGGA